MWMEKQSECMETKIGRSTFRLYIGTRRMIHINGVNGHLGKPETSPSASVTLGCFVVPTIARVGR